MKNLFATAASVLILGMASSAMAQSNDTQIFQSGANNVVGIEQIGGGANNDSIMRQGQNTGGSHHNTASIIQTGTSIQTNESTIDQDGASNIAIVNQSGASEIFSDRNTSVIDQDGTSNLVAVTQANVQRFNESRVRQDGNNNVAGVTQGGNADNNVQNKSNITQSQNGNEAYLSQGGTFATNESSITQSDTLGWGGDNLAVVTQDGNSDNWSSINQNGGLNVATVTQNAASSSVTNDSTVQQSGYANTTSVFQH